MALQPLSSIYADCHQEAHSLRRQTRWSSHRLHYPQKMHQPALVTWMGCIPPWACHHAISSSERTLRGQIQFSSRVERLILETRKVKSDGKGSGGSDSIQISSTGRGCCRFCSERAEMYLLKCVREASHPAAMLDVLMSALNRRV
mmetsp:Transcript_33476/g.99781  ORF Transcript_33476/g.99781 Transcript_33476/m.99781 type:complete len:145 (-) Transcript_33476:2504-2938(-)